MGFVSRPFFFICMVFRPHRFNVENLRFSSFYLIFCLLSPFSTLDVCKYASRVENEDFCSKPAAPRGLHLLAACYAGHAFFGTSKKEGKKAPLFLCICHARASEHFTFAKQIFHREAISLALVKGQISLAQPAAPPGLASFGITVNKNGWEKYSRPFFFCI